MDFDWLNLPELLWIQILQQLDVKTLLNVSETCTTFNNLLFNTILSKKLILFINLRRGKHLVNIFKHSNRKYRSVKCLHVNENVGKPSADFEVILEILNRFSDSIREIKIDGFNISSSSWNSLYNISCSSWNSLIQTLKYVETFELSYMIFNRVTGIEKSALKIDSLSMVRCDMEHMDIFDGASVNKVKLRDQDINQYEQFLLKHEELKSLTVEMSKMFVNDKLSNVKFSLEYLNLYYASWSNNQHALNFITTQTELQSVNLMFYMYQYGILFLKHIINKNPNLKILYIQFYGGDTSFINELDQIDINLSVTHFACDCQPQNIELSDKMYNLFPNNIVKKCLKFGQLLKLFEEK